MTVSLSRCRALATRCGLAFVLAAAAAAQVPPGHAIVGTFSGPQSAGTAGLFHVPLTGGPVTAITGLPAYLRSTGPQFYHQGISSIAYRSEDGAIVAGTIARAGGPTQGAVELFVFHLSGAAIAQTQQIHLGTVTAGVGGVWVGTLPDGRILVSAADSGSTFAVGPMAGSYFAIVDPSAPAPVTALPNPPGTNGGGGAGVDPDGRFLYYLVNVGPTPTTSLYRFEFATNTAAVIATWPGHIGGGLTCDDDGMVYVSTSDLAATTHHTHAVEPNGFGAAAVTTTSDSLGIAPAGVALDRESGRYLVQGAGFAPGFPAANRNTVSLVDPATGAAQWLAGSPTAWGTLGLGPAVTDRIAGYGRATDGVNHYWFTNFPNPGGQPMLGNLGFTLTTASAPGSAVVSAMALSLGRGSLQVAGLEVLVDPGSIVLSLSNASYPLPIPANAGFAGIVITAQSLHLESGGGFAASRGVELTLQ